MTTQRVPESKLKKEKVKRDRVKAVTQSQGKVARREAQQRATVLKRAVTNARKRQQVERSEAALKRTAEREGKYVTEGSPKVAFVVRTRGIHKVPPRPRKILTLFRLRQIYNGVFLRLNKATMPMLRMIEPWVTYGQLSPSTVQKLVLKRGYAKIGGKRIRLTDNEVVRKALPYCKTIQCFDDIVHELATCGPRFTKVSSTLWPFKLSAPRGGINKKRRHFIEGGDFGNREAYMNQFVKRLI
mmetsp:Transcript_16051/g.22288  ORF Transcript_16051/g.22288 Transcript_16051/m.22288 type:complete len:242 (+) Transcript_16051:62-787(+)|eukprot:CAMPEP_0201489210 /NCGR_PEP_ID=MMETSP0151_2-20130828/21313_1 /ASSEMBLY_ACC=CAM_ASM_000257 /TAXON_ID=200890 /ORGANISM="Paramoeba atlantica, Strain 621/1 / CCAP 1560/9" /LENGTH=241 /DNA_ID=CAMNT_0047874723 /DNA_START=26 /DNA_END=751 /DNA_ORIENTATION=+